MPCILLVRIHGTVCHGAKFKHTSTELKGRDSKMDEEGTPDVTSRTITALEIAIKNTFALATIHTSHTKSLQMHYVSGW